MIGDAFGTAGKSERRRWIFETQTRLVREGTLKPEEGILALRDIETGKTVQAHGGTVSWNEHRRCWILIAVETGGTSMLGEVWYAEADAPLGPWVYARKIVTHDRYSFYNPRHHPYFDQDGRADDLLRGDIHDHVFGQSQGADTTL